MYGTIILFWVVHYYVFGTYNPEELSTLIFKMIFKYLLYG